MNIKEENSQEEKYLHPENKATYSEIVYYLIESNVDEEEIEAIKADLLEILISAQLRGEDTKNILGDYKKYCDELIKECNIKPKHIRVLCNIKFILITISVLLLMYCGCNLVSSKPIFYLDIGALIFCVVIFINVIYFRHYMKTTAFKESKHYKIMIIWIISLALGALAYMYL